MKNAYPNIKKVQLKTDVSGAVGRIRPANKRPQDAAPSKVAEELARNDESIPAFQNGFRLSRSVESADRFQHGGLGADPTNRGCDSTVSRALHEGDDALISTVQTGNAGGLSRAYRPVNGVLCETGFYPTTGGRL